MNKPQSLSRAPRQGVRVAYLCEFPTVLGGERSLLVFLDHAARACIEPVVVAPKSGLLATELDGRGIERLDWPPGGRSEASRLAPALHSRRIDLIHANSLLTADAAHVLSSALSIPAVAHVRDILGVSQARRDRLAELGAVIAVSEAVAAWLRGLGVPHARILRIHNAVDTERLATEVTSASLRSELGLAEDALLVGCVGQIALRKGQDLFLEAAIRLAPRFAQAHFLLVGERYSDKDESRKYENDLHLRAAKAPLRDRVHFLGYRRDIAGVLVDLDVVVVPSRQEPLSRVLLEALAMGVATVATDVGGSREILGQEPAGLLVSPGDTEALAQGVARLLNSANLRLQLAWRGCQRVGEFSPCRQVTAIRSVYERVLARGGG